MGQELKYNIVPVLTEHPQKSSGGDGYKGGGGGRECRRK